MTEYKVVEYPHGFQVIDNNNIIVLDNIFIKECADRIVHYMTKRNIDKVLNLLELHSQYERCNEDLDQFVHLIDTARDSSIQDIYEARADQAESLLDSIYDKIKHA